MNEYNVRLNDGRHLTVYAFTRSDIPTALEAEGIDRSDVAGVTLVEKKALKGKRPKVARLMLEAA